MGFVCGKCDYETEDNISSCPQCADVEEINQTTYSKLRGILDNTKEFVSLKSNEFVDKNPKLKEHAKKISEEVSTRFVESGAQRHIHTIKTKSGETLDVISGQAMYELVQERLSLQDRYNDLLATKLQEALERISELEKKISELNSSEIPDKK